MIISGHQIIDGGFMFMFWACLSGGPSGQLPGTPTYYERLDVTGIIGNVVLVTL